ncbi:MAG: chemotaxis protein CheB [Labilithrix sp.]|nr:chemotaxis protein CheB [Labilithrix sp.]
MGASAGAVDALGALLPELPADSRVPFVVVVHVPPAKPSLLVDLFAAKCALAVRHPFDKQPIEPGIWIAAPDYHLLVERDRTFAVSLDEPVNYSRPSIDVLFEAAADAYGRGLAAVVLTGASRDGAAGARKVRAEGGLVLVQDPAEAEVDVMPRAAIEESNPELVAPLARLAQALRDISRGRP